MKKVIISIFFIYVHTCLCKHAAYLPGDVVIGGLFQIYDNNNGQCTDVQVASVQHVEAVKWVFKNLNELNYMPGIDIGFLALPTCRDTDRANNKTFDLVSHMRNELFNKCNEAVGPIAGIIGPEFSSEAETTSSILSSLPMNQRVLQIGYSTTAMPLSNKDVYKNFYRTVPSDDIQILTMIELMKRLQWNYVAIIYEDDSYGNGGRKLLEEMASKESICIANRFPIPVINGVVSYNELESILGTIIQKAITGVVFIGTKTTANALLVTAQRSAFKEKPTFLFSEGTGLKASLFHTSSNEILDAGKGSFIVNPTKRSIQEFSDYWKRLFTNVTALITEARTNPWLTDVFHLYTGCSLSNDASSPGCVSMTTTQIEEKFEDALYISYAVETALIFAKLLHNIYATSCGVGDHCLEKFLGNIEDKSTLINGLSNAVFDFKSGFPLKLSTYTSEPKSSRFIDNVYTILTSSPVYEVYHYRTCLPQSQSFCLEKIGNLTNESLNLQVSLIKDYHRTSEGHNWPDVNKAQCSVGRHCSECQPSNLADQVYFSDGDVLVVGIVPIYDKDLADPLACDGIRPSLSVEIAEGMLFAVKTVNDKTGIFADYFTDKKVGVIIINSCNQLLATQNKILRLHQDGIRLSNGTYIKVSHKIMGYVGAYGSSISIASSEILSRLGYVQVSYASTAFALSDRNVHPYFMRVCTPDDKQANSMIKLVQELESNYIQIVYSEGAYGEGGHLAVKRVAQANKICIANEIKVEEGKYNTVLDALRKNAYAKIVIIFLRSHYVAEVMGIFDNNMDHGEFVFIGSEAWGWNKEVINGRSKLFGSFVVSLEMAQNPTFEDYLNSKDPATYTENPWFQHFMETKYGCYISSSYDKSSATQCDANLRLTRPITGQYYQQDHWTPFAMNAMFSFLMGSNMAFKELCGSNRKTLCDDFQRRQDLLWSKIAEQKLDILGTGRSVSVFDANGDGNVGYRIYNIQKDPLNTQNLVYVDVGKAPVDERQFVFEKSKVSMPDELELPSTCPNDRICTLCFGVEETTTVSASAAPQIQDNSVTAPLAAIIGVLGLALIVLIVIIVCLCSRRPACLGTQDDVYLNATDTGTSKDTEEYDGIRESRMRYYNASTGNFSDKPDITNIEATVSGYSEQRIDTV